MRPVTQLNPKSWGLRKIWNPMCPKESQDYKVSPWIFIFKVNSISVRNNYSIIAQVTSLLSQWQEGIWIISKIGQTSLAYVAPVTCSLAEREVLRKCMISQAIFLFSLAFAKAAKNGEIEDWEKIKGKKES